jgi:hypothetical protein
MSLLRIGVLHPAAAYPTTVTMSLPYINYVERDQKFTKLAFRAPNHFQPLSQFTEMAQEVSFDSLDRRGSPSGVNGTMPIEWESLLGDPLGMNPAHSLVCFLYQIIMQTADSDIGGFY